MEEYANQQLQLGGVSNQRELLLAYEMWFRLVKFSNIMDLTDEQIIDKFLSQQ